MIPVFPGSSNAGSGVCLIRFISRRRLRSILSVATVALQNFVNFSNQRFTTASNVSLLTTCTRLLDLGNVSGSNVNNYDFAGMPVDLSFLVHSFSISTLVNPYTSGIYETPEGMRLFDEVIYSFISTRHSLLSLEHTKEDLMLVSKQDFEIIMTSAGIDQEEQLSITSEFCFSSRSNNNQIRLDWWRSGHSSSTSAHLSFLVFVLFDVATRNVLHPGIVYRLMYSMLRKLLNLVRLGGNRLVLSMVLDIFSSVLAINRSSIAILQGRHQDALQDQIVVVSEFCRICNRTSFICFSYLNESENILSLYNEINFFEEIAYVIETKIRSLVNLLPYANICNQSLLIAGLDFFTDQIATTFSEVPVLPVMPLRGTATPCSLLELSLSAIYINDQQLNDPRILELVATSWSSYSDCTTVEARRAEFIRMTVVQRIFSRNLIEINSCRQRWVSFMRVMSLNVAPGNISATSWISFIRFVRRVSTSLVHYETGTRILAALEIIMASIENNSGNFGVLCHTFALAIMFFLQESAGVDSPDMARCIFNFVFRSLYQEANAVIGSAPDISLADIESEFIVSGRIYPPT